MYYNKADVYLEKAYYIDLTKKGEKDNVKLYQRGVKEWPKYSVYGLKVRGEHTAKMLSELNVGEKYEQYLRVK